MAWGMHRWRPFNKSKQKTKFTVTLKVNMYWDPHTDLDTLITTRLDNP